MKDYREILNIALNKLEDHYSEFGSKMEMDYTYGFFDAVAVIKEMLEAPPSDMRLHDTKAC